MNVKPLVPLLLVAAGLFGMRLPSGAAADKEQAHGFLDLVYKSPQGEESKYVLFVPADYQGDKPYPLILSLHGDGERGTDGKKPSKAGLGRAVKDKEKTFPFLTLFPQWRKSWAADSEDGRRIMAILADVQKNFRVDPKRLYVTGMSSGGDSTWSYAVAYPDRWAGMVPVCGNGDPKDAPKIKHIPCWYFFGGADNKAWLKNAHEMVKALKDAGGEPIYTEYPGMGHGIWGKAYGTPELWEWLLKQHRK